MRYRTVLGVLVVAIGVQTLAAAVKGKKSFSVVIENRALRIKGTELPESIVIQIPAKDAKITIQSRRTDVKAAPEQVAIAFDAFDRIEIDAGAGADFVNIIDPAQRLDAKRKGLDIVGGDGDNIVAVTRAPFAPETATRMRSLLDVSARVAQLARRAADATAMVLQSDAMKHVDRMRAIADEEKAIAAQAETEIFAPAKELLEKKLPATFDMANALVARIDRVEKDHQRLVADLTRQLEPTNGVYPPDEMGEPSTEPTGPQPDIVGLELRARARGEISEKESQKLGTEAERQITSAANAIERQANAILARIDALEQRSERLADTAESAGTNAEKELTASADRVLAIVAELRALSAALDEAGHAVRDEILRSEKMATVALPMMLSATHAGANCSKPSTMKTYTGGSGFDFFFPISAPSAGWSVNGGNGTNILFGGSAADDIRGGANTDVIFGLKGNDWIHGGSGVDIIAGEFILDMASLTGDDCIWGEGDIDLIAGDNLISSTSGTKGGSDTLSGGADIDLIFGDDVLDFFDNTLLGGDDYISGDEGIDALFGCGGDDQIKGNGDIDLAVGNGGNDTIDGHDGRDVTIAGTKIHFGNLLIGNPGVDEIRGGKGIDIAFGNPGADRMWGGQQLDLMFGGPDADEMRGEAGGVIATIEGVPIRLGNLMLGGSQGDQMWGGGDLDVMLGQGEDDRIIGFEQSSFNAAGIDMDVLHGGDGNDYLEGDDEFSSLTTSHDFMFGRGGNDTMKGGANIDFMFGREGEDVMEGDSNALSLPFSIDLMFGGDDNDTMKGGNSLDLMLGRGGDDTMSGDDEAVGVLSPDLMWGGDGADLMNGGSMIDLMFGGDGPDWMTGDSNLFHEPLSLDFMFGNAGADEMDGGNALDLMFGQSGNDRMLGDGSLQARVSPDFLFGGDGDDTMDGGVNPDFLFGMAGNDTMFGDTGLSWMIASIDFMFGGDDCDTMSGGRSFDFMWGGAGADRMDGQADADLVVGGDGSDTMNGGDGLDFLFGRAGDDLVHGDSFIDIIDGGNGDDCLYGDGFVDLVVGDFGNDDIRGGSAPDILAGGPGNDRIDGESGMDFLFGEAGEDRLDGGPGSDRLAGGAGSDRGWGGPGIDRFWSVEQKVQGGSNPDPWVCDSAVGTLCVRKFDDRNRNGVEDSGEAGLANWIFSVTCGCGASASLTTDANGNACTMLPPGPCKVTETLQEGWVATTAITQDANVPRGRTTTASFGNRKPVNELCISKFDDVNVNGVRDANEPPLAGWTFYIWVPGTQAVLTTDANGSACTELRVRLFTAADSIFGYVLEQQQPGWTATTPSVIVRELPHRWGTMTLPFGNHRNPNHGKLCITKFNDLDGDGVKKDDEPTLSGWFYEVTGRFTNLAFTDASGTGCMQVDAGTYTVFEKTYDNWGATTDIEQTMTVINGQTSELKFGNQSIETGEEDLCITAFEDRNGDGLQNNQEPGLEGFEFRIIGGSRGTTNVTTGPSGSVCVRVPNTTYLVIAQPKAGWSPSPSESVRQTITVRPPFAQLKFGYRRK